MDNHNRPEKEEDQENQENDVDNSLSGFLKKSERKPHARADENESLREFAAKAIRTKKTDHIERLFLDLYVSSFYLPPLDGVIRTVKAIFVFSTSKLIEHGIDPRLIQKIKEIAISLNSPIVTKTDSYSCYCIAWGTNASKENYDYFFSEWEIYPEYFPDKLDNHKEVFRRFHCNRCNRIVYNSPRFDSSNQPPSPRRCPECGLTMDNQHTHWVDYGVPIESPWWSFFFDATSNALSEKGYHMLVNRFVPWADTVLDEPIRKLLSLMPQKYLEYVLQQLRELDNEDQTNENYLS
jgi:hypothetical protein